MPCHNNAVYLQNNNLSLTLTDGTFAAPAAGDIDFRNISTQEISWSAISNVCESYHLAQGNQI